MKLAISHTEYRAVDGIFGMHPDAHFMVVCATFNDEKTWTLEGGEKEFRGLLETMYEELEIKKKPSIVRVIDKVEALLGFDSEWEDAEADGFSEDYQFRITHSKNSESPK